MSFPLIWSSLSHILFFLSKISQMDTIGSPAIFASIHCGFEGTIKFSEFVMAY
jgi:hypothetical protein